MSGVAVKWEELDHFYHFEDALAWVAKVARPNPFNEALQDLSVAEVAKRWANSERRVLITWKEEQAKAKRPQAEPKLFVKRRLLPELKVELSAKTQPKEVSQPELKSEPQAEVLGAGVRGIVERATKADFRKGLLTELGEVFESDKSEERLSYNTQKAEVAKAFLKMPSSTPSSATKPTRWKSSSSRISSPKPSRC